MSFDKKFIAENFNEENKFEKSCLSTKISSTFNPIASFIENRLKFNTDHTSTDKVL